MVRLFSRQERDCRCLQLRMALGGKTFPGECGVGEMTIVEVSGITGDYLVPYKTYDLNCFFPGKTWLR